MPMPSRDLERPRSLVLRSDAVLAERYAFGQPDRLRTAPTLLDQLAHPQKRREHHH